MTSRETKPSRPALVAITAGSIAFALIAAASGAGLTTGFDEGVMLLLRDRGDQGMPDGPPWLVQTVIDITAFGGYPQIIVLTAIAWGILVAGGHGRHVGFLVGSIASGALVAHWLKSLFSRARPDLVEQLLDTHTASFPSSHATMSAIFYIALAIVLARQPGLHRARPAIFAAAIFLTFIVGLSRVYLGVHWPSDILAGWSIAAAWLGVWVVLFDWAEKRAHRKGPQGRR